ncbi:MAG: class C sortase [Atopobiaceae bacterium]|jgi:sortase A|nr:class C sortase [Atopobium sp.]MCH4082446.1 class C sortase [Atopobiaceae bacterium]MCI1345097.1 class C sortase [Atopobiaceae bacterium]MCI1498191.1 class C sortase [Atopobiaceae bacterium]MCI1540001.1 class C sortase [Atopobiaceae bacterium]
MKSGKGKSDVQGKGKKKEKKKRLPRWADRLITVLVILFGVALMVWPWVLDRIEASGVLNQISTVSSTVDAMGQEQKDYYLSEARAYNEVLAQETPEIAPNQILPYEQQLTFDRDPMMSWIEIPSIDVSMPIYHGTSDAALMAGVGHLEGTSLPVGGTSTHCVLTAHSGMKNLSMFDDIRDLVPGDIVLLHTMGEVLAYRVDSSEVVWPDEMDSLSIQQGQDLLTLVTCTPYGVNDHRLLVHCERTEYVPEEAEAQGDLANRHWGMREWAVLIVAVVLLLVLLDVIVHRIRQKRKAKAAPKHME